MSWLRVESFTQITVNGPLIIFFNEWAARGGAMQNYNLLEGGSMSMNALLAKVTPYYIFEQY